MTMKLCKEPLLHKHLKALEARYVSLCEPHPVVFQIEEVFIGPLVSTACGGKPSSDFNRQA